LKAPLRGFFVVYGVLSIIFVSMANRFKKHPIRSRIIAVLLLALVIFILILISDNPGFIERYYSNGFYRAICYIFHPVFNLLPFSAGDLFYIGIIGYLVYAMLKMIGLLIRRQWRPAGILFLGLTIGVQGFIICFYLLWGMNYFRPSAAERFNLPDSGYTTADLRSITSMLIDSANNCRARVTAADLQQDNKTIYQTAAKAVATLSANSKGFYTFKPDIKPSILSPLLNYMGTSGYYNPFTSEAQINYQMPVFLKPFVACHEMSHQMGFGPEDEANFAGFMVGIHSQDRLLRYSAYYLGVQEFMFALRRQDSIARKELRKNISTPVLNDFKTERKYWSSYQSKLGVLSGLFYDDFLKANNQPQGLNTYNQMVRLVMGWYKKNNRVR
jgi:sorbitol-specific phosphotransferase system component IIC